MPEETPRLPFEIDETVDPSRVTGRAGGPLVGELFRQLGAAATIHSQVRLKQRQRGVRPAQLVESLSALGTSGGDRCQDRTPLREDRALAMLRGSGRLPERWSRRSRTGPPTPRRPSPGTRPSWRPISRLGDLTLTSPPGRWDGRQGSTHRPPPDQFRGRFS